METLNLAYEGEENAILVITLNRPNVLNAMNTKMQEELLGVLRSERNNKKLRCLILTGAGGKAFSSGGDLKERDGMSDTDWRYQHSLIEEKALLLRDFPIPVFAAVEGYAFGGGFETALSTDIIIASETAKFSLSEVKRGVIPGGGGLQNLPASIGIRKAKEMVFTGMSIDAHTAFEWGIVNRVVPEGKALDNAIEIAKNIAQDSAPLAVQWAKYVLNNGAGLDFHSSYSLGTAAYGNLIGTRDRQEGTAAFREKRKPRWESR